MKIRTFAVLFSVAGCLVACGGEPEAESASTESDLSAASIQVLGTIAEGATQDAAYSATTRYIAYSFTATKGQTVDIWARSTTGGDASAYLLRPSYSTLAHNDDATEGGTQDSHIVAKIATAGTYYIAVRDTQRQPGTFSITLNAPDAAPVTGPARSDADFATSSCTDERITSEQMNDLLDGIGKRTFDGAWIRIRTRQCQAFQTSTVPECGEWVTEQDDATSFTLARYSQRGDTWSELNWGGQFAGLRLKLSYPDADPIQTLTTSITQDDHSTCNDVDYRFAKSCLWAHGVVNGPLTGISNNQFTQSEYLLTAAGFTARAN
jgi:hypothetical protein